MQVNSPGAAQGPGEGISFLMLLTFPMKPSSSFLVPFLSLSTVLLFLPPFPVHGLEKEEFLLAMQSSLRPILYL